jgi:exodeoxyribonuclease VII large subunit
MPENEKTPQAISLLEFNRLIKDTLDFEDGIQHCWVVAETSDVQVRRGHCYLQLIQKDPETNKTVAKVDAVIWANVYIKLSARFHDATNTAFTTGIKVMVEVSANFHEIYGMKLVISDIFPEYTLGDMVRQRMEIIRRLTAEGVIDMNKDVERLVAPQRIAVISAAGAAGYGDFVNQLENNPYGLKFYTCLFSALMQGEKTVPTVIDALNRIMSHDGQFDCVVIIRGGGATTDLNSFDNYDLALNVAQFPLPVIVGIGHERDVTVLDSVATVSVKTPTAAAEFLIQLGTGALAHLNDLKDSIAATVRDSISRSSEQLSYLSSRIPVAVKNNIECNRSRIAHLIEVIPLRANNRIDSENATLVRKIDLIKAATAQVIMREQMRVKSLDEKVNILSPRNTLNRGYSLTVINGHAVTDASQLKPGDEIISHFKNGNIHSTVK